MHRDQLALQMRGQLGDREPGLRCDPLHLVAVILRRSRFFEIEEPGIIGWNLHPRIAAFGGPFRDAGPGVERGFVARELGEEQGRSLDGLHRSPLFRA
jgi:hypothetical protein